MDSGKENNINKLAPKRRLGTKQQSASKKTLKQRKITGWRIWLFRIIVATVIPTLLFVLMEFCLRVFGFGYPTNAIIKCEINGRESYCNNSKFGWRFFPKNISRTSHEFIFPAVKSSKTYRIFILGGSVAQGTPQPVYGFGRILKVLLDEQYPNIDFEVINLGMPAINSHAVLECAKDCARHQPDIFIVYLGNNEVVGPYGAGTVFAPLSPSLSVIRASIAIKATRLGQLFERLLGSFAVHKDAPKRWGGMAMLLEKQVRFDDSALKHVYSHFERNLVDICEVASKAGAKAILCTVGTNLKDNPPFASLHRRGLTEIEKQKWEDIYQQGIAYETAGRYAEAVQQYLAAASIDDSYAELQFRLGRCYSAMERYDKARNRYIKARELDTLQFRATTQINEIIRSVGKNKTEKEIYLVDTAAAIAHNSPYETPGKELFWEHAHLNFKGNYIVAGKIFEQIEKILPEYIVKRKNKSTMLAEKDCAKRLAYTGWDHYNLAHYVLTRFIKTAPFTNQLYHDERVREIEQRIKSLRKYTRPLAIKNMATQYQTAIQQNPSDWDLRQQYGCFLNRALKKPKAAAEQFQIAIQQFPTHFAYSQLGELYMRYRTDEAIDEAINYFRKSLEILPTFATSHLNLALAFQMKKQNIKSAEHYSKAIELDPRCSDLAYRNLGDVFTSLGEFDKAGQTLRNGIKFYPDNADLHFYLSVVLRREGKISDAINELQAALRIQPDHALAQRQLKELTINDKH
jgi:tetratricopeptide (TPR) repeat protein